MFFPERFKCIQNVHAAPPPPADRQSWCGSGIAPPIESTHASQTEHLAKFIVETTAGRPNRFFSALRDAADAGGRLTEAGFRRVIRENFEGVPPTAVSRAMALGSAPPRYRDEMPVIEIDRLRSALRPALATSGRRSAARICGAGKAPVVHPSVMRVPQSIRTRLAGGVHTAFGESGNPALAAFRAIDSAHRGRLTREEFVNGAYLLDPERSLSHEVLGATWDSVAGHEGSLSLAGFRRLVAGADGETATNVATAGTSVVDNGARHMARNPTFETASALREISAPRQERARPCPAAPAPVPTDDTSDQTPVEALAETASALTRHLDAGTAGVRGTGRTQRRYERLRAADPSCLQYASNVALRRAVHAAMPGLTRAEREKRAQLVAAAVSNDPADPSARVDYARLARLLGATDTAAPATAASAVSRAGICAGPGPGPAPGRDTSTTARREVLTTAREEAVREFRDAVRAVATPAQAGAAFGEPGTSLAPSEFRQAMNSLGVRLDPKTEVALEASLAEITPQGARRLPVDQIIGTLTKNVAPGTAAATRAAAAGAPARLGAEGRAGRANCDRGAGSAGVQSALYGEVPPHRPWRGRGSGVRATDHVADLIGAAVPSPTSTACRGGRCLRCRVRGAPSVMQDIVSTEMPPPRERPRHRVGGPGRSHLTADTGAMTGDDTYAEEHAQNLRRGRRGRTAGSDAALGEGVEAGGAGDTSSDVFEDVVGRRRLAEASLHDTQARVCAGGESPKFVSSVRTFIPRDHDLTAWIMDWRAA